MAVSSSPFIFSRNGVTTHAGDRDPDAVVSPPLLMAFDLLYKTFAT